MTITKKEVKEAVTEALAEHPCRFNGEELSLLYDLISIGRWTKRFLIIAMALTLLYQVGAYLHHEWRTNHGRFTEELQP